MEKQIESAINSIRDLNVADETEPGVQFVDGNLVIQPSLSKQKYIQEGDLMKYVDGVIKKYQGLLRNGGKLKIDMEGIEPYARNGNPVPLQYHTAVPELIYGLAGKVDAKIYNILGMNDLEVKAATTNPHR